MLLGGTCSDLQKNIAQKQLQMCETIFLSVLTGLNPSMQLDADRGNLPRALAVGLE
jgi:hypothetical protein